VVKRRKGVTLDRLGETFKLRTITRDRSLFISQSRERFGTH